MNCFEISENLGHVVREGERFGRALGRFDIQTAILSKVEIKRLFSAEFIDVLDLFEVRFRDRIARKNDFAFVSTFSEDRAWAYSYVSDGPRPEWLRLIDREGVTRYIDALAPVPEHTVFRNGVAWIKAIDFNNNNTGCWKLIDREGRVLHVTGYEETVDTRGFAESGLVLVKSIITSRYRFVGSDGKPAVSKADFLFATPFCEGLSWLEYDDRHELVSSERNFQVIKTVSQVNVNGVRHPTIFSDGISHIKNTDYDGYSFFDKKGDLLFSGRFKKVGDFHEGKCLVEDEYRCYFIDKEGKKVTATYKYAEDFSEGLASVISDPSDSRIDFHYYIDHDGVEHGVEENFHYAESFHEGMAVVTKRKLKGSLVREKQWFINHNFDPAFAETYDEIIEPFHDGVARVSKDGEDYYIDRKGKRLFES